MQRLFAPLALARPALVRPRAFVVSRSMTSTTIEDLSKYVGRRPQKCWRVGLRKYVRRRP